MTIDDSLYGKILEQGLSQETEDKDTMIRVDGRFFHCSCGGNVFRKLKDDPNRYCCNSCLDIYWGK